MFCTSKVHAQLSILYENIYERLSHTEYQMFGEEALKHESDSNKPSHVDYLYHGFHKQEHDPTPSLRLGDSACRVCRGGAGCVGEDDGT